jgi:hypothetical protein
MISLLFTFFGYSALCTDLYIVPYGKMACESNLPCELTVFAYFGCAGQSCQSAAITV